MDKMLKFVKKLQKREITEQNIILKIKSSVKGERDRKILEEMANEEGKHYNIWKSYTKVDVKPNYFAINWFVFLSHLLGYTFVIKFLENMTDDFLKDEKTFKKLIELIPEASTILTDELNHKVEFIELIDEERLKFVGSIILGLNDALIGISGTLVGFTFAYQNTHFTAMTTLISGMAAVFSMTSSEYLSSRAEGKPHAVRSGLSTGLAYFSTLVLLILPYCLLPKHMYIEALIIMLAMVFVIILAFNYYISVAKDLPFRRRFLEMAIITSSVMILSFLIGVAVKKFLGVDV